MRRRSTLVSITAALLFLQSSPLSAEAPRKLRVGLITPLTGGTASFGVPAMRGAELAIKDLGIHGKVELVVEDDTGCQEKSANNAFHALTAKGPLDAVISLCTAGAHVVLPFANRQKFPLLQLSEGDIYEPDQMLQLFPASYPITEMIAADIAKRRKSIALVLENFTVNRANFEHFKKAYEAGGGKILYAEFVDSGTTDLKTIITKIKGIPSEAVSAFIWNPPLMATFLREAEQQRLWENHALEGNFCFELQYENFVKAYPPLATMEGLLSANLIQSTTDGFRDSYRRAYGEEPAQFADYGYDAVQMLNRCGTEMSCLTKPFSGASGEVQFDKNGVRVGTFALKRLRAGKFVPVTP